MKLSPKQADADIYAGLTPLERKTRIAAIALAFVGVFVWAVKILFL